MIPSQITDPGWFNMRVLGENPYSVPVQIKYSEFGYLEVEMPSGFRHDIRTLADGVHFFEVLVLSMDGWELLESVTPPHYEKIYSLGRHRVPFARLPHHVRAFLEMENEESIYLQTR